jgi:histidine triad (HIT) family protein
MNCLFCNIAEGKTPASIIYRDEWVVAFDDINPQAPHHKLIIPQKHIATLDDLQEEDSKLVGHMVKIASTLAKQLGLNNPGYRVVFNCNAGAGQSVFHIHAHLLGGRRFTWPPG